MPIASFCMSSSHPTPTKHDGKHSNLNNNNIVWARLHRLRMAFHASIDPRLLPLHQHCWFNPKNPINPTRHLASPVGRRAGCHLNHRGGEINSEKSNIQLGVHHVNQANPRHDGCPHTHPTLNPPHNRTRALARSMEAERRSDPWFSHGPEAL